jgi:phenylacetate-CoA ligase
VAYGGRAQKFVYRHLPQGLRSLAATYYALRTYPTRHGPYFHEHLVHLKQNERLPDEELEKIQLRKLKALVAYAAERVPYYRSLFRERGIAPADIASLADLRRIPLLDKEAVRVNQSGLLAEGVRRGDLLCIHTSGTTGTPLDLYQTREFFQKEYAFWWFHRSWAGIHLGDRTATLAGHPVAPVDQEKPPFWIRNYRENQMLFSSYHLSPENLGYYCRALEAFGPKLIHGYPSSIYLVALHLNDNRMGTVRPKGIFTSSETTLAHQREEIERAFGCRVYSYYGNAERAGYIGECEEGSMHAMSEHSIVEFLGEDGEPVGPGRQGVLVCTNIENTAMPLIRYVTGDVVVPLPEGQKCPCGRGGRLVESVLGRVEDYVVTPEGNYVGRLDHIFKGVHHVREAQIFQPSRERVVVRIVKEPAFGSEDEKALVANARERLGRTIDIAVDLVDRIERTRTGKFKFIVSDVPREERLRVSRRPSGGGCGDSEP